MNFVQIILILVGLITIALAVFKWEWIKRHWKAKLFVNIFGHSGARVFYIVFGLAIIAFGLFWLR